MTAGQWEGLDRARDGVVSISRSMVGAVRGNSPWDGRAMATLAKEMNQVIVGASPELEGNWVSVFVLPPGGEKSRAEMFTTHDMRKVSSFVCRLCPIYIKCCY